MGLTLRINGKTHYLWRAVDHEGEVVEVFVTKRRDRRAALEFLTRAMKRYGRPASIVTDRLPSYRAAMKVIGNEGCQETGRWLNNRAEKLTSTLSKAGRGNGSVQRHQDPAEIHLRPCLDPQPFQPPTPSQSPRHFQTRPSRRPGRVASTCSLIVLDCRFFGSSLISLTMPWAALMAKGLSPRVRGSHLWKYHCFPLERSIPACAGEPRWSACVNGNRKLHTFGN